MTHAQDIKSRRDGIELTLEGIISETSDFESFQSDLDHVEKINFGNLRNISWIGLVRLDETLSTTNKRFTLCNIPWTIYRSLRFLPGIQFRYEIESIQLELYNAKTLINSEEVLSVNMSELRKATANLKHEIFAPDDELIVEGQRSELLPEDFLKPKLTHFHNNWFNAHHEECIFWSRYLSFWVAVTELSVDMMESRIADYETLLSNMYKFLKPIEEILNLSVNKDVGLENRFAIIKAWLHEEGDGLRENLDRIVQYCKQENRRFRQYADQEFFFDGRRMYQIVSRVSSYMSEELNFLDDLETLGHQFSEALFDIDLLQRLKNILDGFDFDTVSDDSKAEIIKMINFDSSSLKSKSFEELCRAHIEKTYDEVESEINKSIVISQGLDLLRQVLEHRKSEALEIHATIKSLPKEHEQTWIEYEKGLYKKFTKWLVTDQEKYAFSFYFTEVELNSDDDSKAPGEIMFF